MIGVGAPLAQARLVILVKGSAISKHLPMAKPAVLHNRQDPAGRAASSNSSRSFTWSRASILCHDDGLGDKVVVELHVERQVEADGEAFDIGGEADDVGIGGEASSSRSFTVFRLRGLGRTSNATALPVSRRPGGPAVRRPRAGRDQDGDCALCGGGAGAIAIFDRERIFRIGRPQSDLGAALVRHYGLEREHPETWLYLEEAAPG